MLDRSTVGAVLGVILLALAPLAGSTTDERHDVEVTLACDAEAVTAGSTFEVAVLFEMEEEWHIYWRDPGDSGLATSAVLTVPDGFEVTGPRFPAPEVVPLAGGLISYAYHDEVALFFDVTAPAEVAPETELAFHVRADWLVCKEACFMGDAEARLEFVAGEGGGASKGLAKALDRSRARMPRPMKEIWNLGWRWSAPQPEAGTGKYVVELQLKPVVGRSPQLIPDSTGGLALRQDEHPPAPPGQFVFESREHPDGTTARGVLVLTTDEGPQYYALEVPYEAPTQDH